MGLKPGATRKASKNKSPNIMTGVINAKSDNDAQNQHKSNYPGSQLDKPSED